MGRLTLNFVPRSSPLASNLLPPLFLLPAFVGVPCQCFSTSPRISAPKRYREKNKQRGVSAIRRTGPRIPLSISKYELPRPVVNPPARKEFKTNPEHGLWGFFNKEKTPMSEPEDEMAYGRAWTYAELSTKSFDDLHALYWVCVKEKNRISTSSHERSRVYAGYGDFEAEARYEVVEKTQKRIKEVLADRFHSWQEARAILQQTRLADLRLFGEEVEDKGSYEEGSAQESTQVSEPPKPPSLESIRHDAIA